MTHALGIDIGTTNAKVALVDESGRLLASSARPINTVRDAGRAEQDAELIWTAVVEAVQAVIGPAGGGTEIGHIGIDSQYSSTVPVDRDCRPVGPLITYLDRRGTDHCHAIFGREPDAFTTFVERHGIPPVGAGLSLSHILYYQLDRPEIHERTHAYLEPMEYIAARLTGVVAANQCTQFSVQLMDNRRLDQLDYDPDLVRMSGVDPSRLPPIRPVAAPIGHLLPSVAAELGIPSTAVVHGAINDSHAGAIATGARTHGRAGIMIGTTSVVLDTTDHHGTDLDHEVLSMPGPMPGEYLIWAENGLGGKVLEHLLEHIVHASDELGDHTTPDHFARIDATLRSVPAGSNNVLFLPWLAGSLSPRADGNTRGGFLNLSLDTERRHLIRAAIEGLSLNLGWLLPIVEQFSGTAVNEIVFGGGGARSSVWPQILADVLDRPVATVTDPHQMIARSTALYALYRGGLLTLDDLTAMVQVDARFEPNAHHRATYRVLQEQFIAAFDALRPIYATLNG